MEAQSAHAHSARLTPGTLVRKKHLLQRVPFSEATLWRRIKDGRFPAPSHRDGQVYFWDSDEVEAHLDRLRGAPAVAANSHAA